jgi:DNA-binding CsgD family transcriptional regulator
MQEETVQRWVETTPPDPAAFYADHPECVLTPERMAALEPYVNQFARLAGNKFDADRQEEQRQAIWVRIAECATAYRSTDPLTGQPVYDFLSQNPSYIVMHAAARVRSAVRREVGAKERLGIVSFETPIASSRDGETVELGSLIAARTVEAVDEASHNELAQKIAARLSPAQRRLFVLIAEGATAAEAGHLIGLKRQTVHDHMKVIRQVTREVVGDSLFSIIGRPHEMA